MNTNWIHTVQQSTGFRKYQLNVLTDASNHIAKCDTSWNWIYWLLLNMQLQIFHPNSAREQSTIHKNYTEIRMWQLDSLEKYGVNKKILHFVAAISIMCLHFWIMQSTTTPNREDIWAFHSFSRRSLGGDNHKVEGGSCKTKSYLAFTFSFLKTG